MGQSQAPGLVQRGLTAGLQGVEGYLTDQQKKDEENKPLTPFEQYAALVATGQMSGRDAAIHMQLGVHPEIAMTPTGPGVDPTATPGALGAPAYVPGPAAVPGPGLGGTPPSPEQAPAMPPQGALGYNAPAPIDRSGGLAGTQGMMVPRTRKDYNAAMQVAPFVTKQTVAETQATAAERRANLIQDAIDKRNAESIESKEKLAGEKQDWEKTKFKEMMQYRYDALSSREEIAKRSWEKAQERMNTRVGGDLQIAALNQFIKDADGYEDAITKIVTSINSMGGDPNAVAELETKRQALKAKKERAEQLAKEVQDRALKMTQPTSASTTTTTTQSAGTAGGTGQTVPAAGAKQNLKRMFGK